MKILIVDDEPGILAALETALAHPDWTIETTTSPKAALARIAAVDLLLVDVRMPEMDGIELLEAARKTRPNIEAVVMTAYGTIPSAVKAIQSGARAYILKPPKHEELLSHLHEVRKNIHLREVAARSARGDLVGSSPAMQQVYRQIDEYSCSQAPVLITGETGTGKELAARAVHHLTARKKDVFVPINLATLPRELAESELFGHKRGAFTGASADVAGRFLLAEGGTLFLDEVDCLQKELQPKLLRAIEQKEVWPLAGDQPRKINVRIIAATNKRIEELVRDGTFREDLYYRLNVLRIEMPPLREHPEDIPQIVRALLDRTASSYPSKMFEIPAQALSSLMTHSWPGNVRELSNTLERAVAKSIAAARASKSVAPVITLDLDMTGGRISRPPHDLPFKQAKADMVREWTIATIRFALSRNRDNASRAAKDLRMSRTALLRLIQKYRIRKSDET